MSPRAGIRIVSAKCVAVQDSADRLRRILVILLKRRGLLKRQSRRLHASRKTTSSSIIVGRDEVCFNGMEPR